MRLFLAFRAFFVVLFRHDSALKIRELLDRRTSTVAPEETKRLPDPIEIKSTSSKPTAPAASKQTRRSEALTLLSALQRESRLLDLVCDSLDQYDDAQIGAAARDVLRDTRKSLDRMFGLKPLVDSGEGEAIEIPKDATPVRWRIVGKDSGQRGTLIHPGWQATKLDMPQWSGGTEDAMVIAAVEVET